MANINTGSDELWGVLQRMAREYLKGKLTLSGLTPTQNLALGLAPIYVTNDSGETIPAYGCMQITGTEEIGSQNFLVADKPVDTDGTAGAFLFNGPQAIADGEDGIAQSGPVVRGYKNTGTVTGGDRWLPVAGQWYLSQDADGQFIACGADDVGTDVLKIVDASGSGGNTSLYRFTLNADFSTGTADADILEPDGTDTTIDANVLDPLSIFDTLVNGDPGWCILSGGAYYAIQAPCSGSGGLVDGGSP